MCTVTYYPTATGCIMTSNRDEIISRPAAEHPAISSLGDKQLLYPRDPQAGGTWFVADNSGNVAILFNGGFEKHRHEPPYRRSRGLILLDLHSQDRITDAFDTIQLSGIEPFSILSFQQTGLFRFTWTGQEKVTEELDTQVPVLFSSAPLYTPENRSKRSSLFDIFVQKENNRSADDIFAFHAAENPDDPENGFVMRRPSGVMTRSITQTVIEKAQITMRHVDLLSGNSSAQQLLLH